VALPAPGTGLSGTARGSLSAHRACFGGRAPGTIVTDSGSERCQTEPRLADAPTGRRATERVDGVVVDRVLELAVIEPAAACDAQLAQQRDVRRRAAEADAADAPPLAQDDR
jgi:hypothetical protein